MTVSFDTLSFAKRLTEAGEKPAVAEAHAPSSRKMPLKEFVMDTIATKADIREVGEEIEDLRDAIGDVRGGLNEVRGEIKEIRQEIGDIRGEIKEVRGEIKEIRSEAKDFREEFLSFRKEVSERFATKDELRHEIGFLRKDIDAMGLKLTVRMGGMLAIAVGAVATLGKVL